MRLLPCLLLALAAAPLALPPAQAQPPPATGTLVPLPPDGFRPLAQTADGQTLRVLDARWLRAGEVATPQAFDSYYHNPANCYLVVWYTLTPDSVANDPRHSPLFPSAALRLPGGSEAVGFPTLDHHLPTPTRMTLWGDIDPRASAQDVSFEMLRAGAPEGANGHVKQVAEFAGVPLPAGAEAAALTGQTRTTANGSRVTLEKIGRRPRRGHPEASDLLIVGRWQAPPAHPDLAADVRFPARNGRGEAQPGVESDTGEVLSSYGEVSDDDPLDPAGKARDRFTIHAQAPAAGAKTVTVRLQLDETGPSLRQAPAYQRFAFALPRASIALPAPPPPSADKPLATQPLDDASLSVTGVTPEPGRGSGLVWHFGLRLSAPEPQTEAGEWLATDTLWNAAGNDARTVSAGLHEGIFWTPEGLPLPPNVKQYDFRTSLDANRFPKPPTAMDITVKWRRIARIVQSLTFRALPIPPAGTVLSLSKPAEADKASSFLIRRIGAFDAAHPLSPKVAARLPGLGPDAGLAVVLQCPSSNVAVDD